MERKILLKEDIINSFKAMGMKRGDTLIIHTSLKSLGFVVGGPETVIRAVLEIIGNEGTIVVPTQTWKNLDPEKGVHWLEPQKWWDIIRENWPAYDKDVTPSMAMGKVAEMVRTWPGSRRSDHPARSFGAIGKYAEYITENHDLENIFGMGSPLHKIYELNGKVLLLGVGHNKSTSLHLAECLAEYEGKEYTEEISAVIVNGERKRVKYNTLDVDDEDFQQIGRDYEKAKGIKIKTIGNGKARYLDQRDYVDYATNWMEENR